MFESVAERQLRELNRAWSVTLLVSRTWTPWLVSTYRGPACAKVQRVTVRTAIDALHQLPFPTTTLG
jgi:hypothetical protein